MNVIVCVDDKLGTMFNKRRQSRDKILCEKVVSLLNGKRLLIKPYSFDLFKDYDVNIAQYENYLNFAGNDDYCFVEGDELLSHQNTIESIVLFRWNRDYPSDKKFDIDLSCGWCVTHTEEFQGNSHEKITMEIYKRSLNK